MSPAVEWLLQELGRLDPDDSMLREAEKQVQAQGWVLVASANEGVLPLALNLRASCRKVGVADPLFYCFDECTRVALEKIGVFARELGINGVENNYQLYGSPKFRDICVWRLLPLLYLLEQGLPVLSVDVDVAFLRNPLSSLPTGKDVIGQYGGKSREGFVRGEMDLCMGLVGFPNPSTGQSFLQGVMEKLRFHRDQPYYHDQSAANELLREEEASFSVTLLEPLAYPNGAIFQEAIVTGEMTETPFLVHANYLSLREEKIDLLDRADGWSVGIPSEVRKWRWKQRFKALPLVSRLAAFRRNFLG